jgi:hypothetical protein
MKEPIQRENKVSIPPVDATNFDTDVLSALLETVEYRRLPDFQKNLALHMLARNGDHKAVFDELNLSKWQRDYSRKALKTSGFRAFIDAAHEVIARTLATRTSWTLQQSLLYSKKMIGKLETALHECDMIENNSQRIQRIVDISKAVQFWKENLDKLHGFLVDTTRNMNVSANLRELAEVKDDQDLVAMATRLTHLAEEAKRRMTAPQPVVAVGEDGAAG